MSLPLDVQKSLHDVLQAARDIEAYTKGLDHAAYIANDMVQAAVERKFEIIGEALSRLARSKASVLERISDHARIIGFRNIIAHGYDAVDHEIVWEAVRSYLPKLRQEVERLLAD